MAWYSAHLVMYSMFKDGIQDKFPLREDVVLIEADSVGEAFDRAKRRGKEREGDDQGTHSYDGRASNWVFIGVRKLIECDLLVNDRPGDGSEVSYSMLEVRDRASVQRFAKGEPVEALYRE
ncbi:hypothetical protein Isop_3472 [Isosphaera pallida ATCC 43644]|jgi:hypothetical protein|uniref:DUF4288 domain-containing protein n=1 Tax=Isosphaera pallida (strain ATCC 43644 / DSM 9630 / IS1B) TaxID=575540 RepID=E8QWZ0_ISOPI|nr:DUF4288 domain-containing protein [Isosphaera pallida]ADV64029.1 hypothetical protein Isop_3472 [Isosphaera pallida ATCC 43644]